MDESVWDEPSRLQWMEFSREIKRIEDSDYRNGLSYVISGSLALAGGLAGSSMTGDNMEKGIYTVFQTIGIASIGYGAYAWKIGGEERSIYSILQATRLTNEQKTHFLKVYAQKRQERLQKERVIKAITHALIAGLNLYNAQKQQQDGIKSALYFVGGVNLLAAVGYSFDF